MPDGCSYVLDSYLFDFTPLTRKLSKASKNKEIKLYLEAPQGFVRLLRRISGFLEECLASRGYRVSTHVKLEPSFGACSLSIDDLRYIGENVFLIHIGHEPYVYPLCVGRQCMYEARNGNIVFIPGEYLGGDTEKLLLNIVEFTKDKDVKRLGLGYSVQHKSLAHKLATILSQQGYEVKIVAPVLGCYYYNLLKQRELVDAYMIVAGGYFHALGLGLALGGSKIVMRVDPYTNRVEDISRDIVRVLSKRYWLLASLDNVRNLGIIMGLLPGQYRPWIASFIESLAQRRGIKTQRLYARYLSREILDNLSPDDYDAYVVTSCPRLAIDDLGDYWKPVLTPAEARLWLMSAKYELDYTFPW